MAAVLLSGGLFSLPDVSAQSEKTGWESYEYVNESNPWLQSYNAAGLRSFALHDISTVRLYLNKQNGRLINYYESDNSYTYGGEVRSFYRLNPKTVFYGSVNYQVFDGLHMGGSAFINPYNNPFDIVEYADSTRGEKKRETYQLSGAFSTDIYRGLTLGAKLDYSASNYAKYKDLRPTNEEMDMTFSLGLSYRFSSLLKAGLNVLYHRRTEEMSFGMYGNTDQEYNSLIDFGAFYGRQERFSDNSEYTSGSGTNPLFDSYKGVSFQLDFTLSSQLSFYNELTLKNRDGYFGRKGTATIVYTEHDSKILEYKGHLSYRMNKDLHTFALSVGHEQLTNNENSYQKNTRPNGGSEIVYLGQTKMLDKTDWSARGVYTANINVVDFNPAWVLKVFAAYKNRKQTVSLYPDYRKQSVYQYMGGISAGKNLTKGLNQYGLLLDFSYLSGAGTVKEDGRYDHSQSQSKPVSLDSYLYREFDYWTVGRLQSAAGFRYSRLFANRMKGYVQFNYALTNAFEKTSIGQTFHNLTLAVGVGF